MLLDVREPVQFDIVRLKTAISWPLGKIKSERAAAGAQRGLRLDSAQSVVALIEERAASLPCREDPFLVVCLCRRGVDSVEAATLLNHMLNKDGKRGYDVCDVKGGLLAWAADVDQTFPIY